jgi:light-regulated signal transduction histidine kinase (bacteriophytochrome)
MSAADVLAADGQVDLTSCDREPIHQLGQIQPWGFLLAAGTDEIVTHASANVTAHLGLPPEDVIGRALDTLLDRGALHEIRGRLQALQGLEQTDRLFDVPLLSGRPNYDVAIHYAPGDAKSIVMEAEPCVREHGFDPIATVKGMMARVLRADDPKAMHAHAARLVRRMLGFDRVMVYQFDTDGSGHVVGESVAPGVESFLGLRYPAADLPVQARALYCRNWLRLIADTKAANVRILPEPEPGQAPLDLSSSVLRGVSAVHIEYLGNMGVTASLSVSIMRGQALWGLMACHHMQPLLPSFQRRSAAELFAQLYSLQVESRERADAARYDAEARALNARVLALLAGDDDPASSLKLIVQDAGALVPCDGVVIHFAGRTELMGMTPDETMLAGLLAALHQSDPPRVFATTEIARFHPPAALFADVAVGMLVIPISRTPRDYLIFFRREVVRTVTWAGEPEKAGPADRLSPRGSFAAWAETVRGQSAPWLEEELRVAEALRTALLEVMVRLLSNAAADRNRASSDRHELLIAELNHRVRNILGLIGALVSRSQESAGTVGSFVTALHGRIQSLARAHDQLTDDHWGPVPLRGMIESEFNAYLPDRQQTRTRLSGLPLLIEPTALTVLALVMHELATNAVKYGALSGDAGSVDVFWWLRPDGSMRLKWRESGGPPVTQPNRRGFGTTVIERTVPFELQGQAEVRHAPDGLEADFTIPARFVHPGQAAEVAVTSAAPRTAAGRCSGTAMLLEDSALLAMDGEEILLGLGFATVEVVATASAALDVLHRLGETLVFALLDLNLGDHTSVPVAEALLKAGIPFAFATGYGKRLSLPDELAAAALVIPKPYRREDIADLVGRSLRIKPDAARLIEASVA